MSLRVSGLLFVQLITTTRFGGDKILEERPQMVPKQPEVKGVQPVE